MWKFLKGGATVIPEFSVGWKEIKIAIKPLLVTLDSGINVAPGITVAPPLKKFHITILLLFYINLGIAVIF